MKTELEVKILDISVEDILKKLSALHAIARGEKILKRYVYDLDVPHGTSWMRLRTDGTDATLTIKKIVSEDIEGMKELEIGVSSFTQAYEMLGMLGFSSKAYQENKRISFILDTTNIEIDFWPHIPPYVEVEGKDIKDIEKIIHLLGFEMNQTTTMNTEAVYEKYGLKLSDFKKLTLQ